MSDPNELFTKTFIRSSERFANIYSLRNIAGLGLPVATYMLHKETASFVKELVYDPKNEKLFIDKEGLLKEVGGVDGLTNKMAAGQVESFQKSIDAASLVFAHSILDDAAFEYCRVTSLVSPNDWEDIVIKKKIDMEQIKVKTYDAILRELLISYMQELENKSLLEKIDKLFKICKPPSGFSRMKNYEFNRERIKVLDQMRHDIVHGDGAVRNLPSGQEDIWYMNQTSHHLMSLVNDKYNMKIDPSILIKYYARKR